MPNGSEIQNGLTRYKHRLGPSPAGRSVELAGMHSSGERDHSAAVTLSAGPVGSLESLTAKRAVEVCHLDIGARVSPGIGRQHRLSRQEARHVALGHLSTEVSAPG